MKILSFLMSGTASWKGSMSVREAFPKALPSHANLPLQVNWQNLTTIVGITRTITEPCSRQVLADTDDHGLRHAGIKSRFPDLNMLPRLAAL